jgi:hypothetical protein
MSVAEQRYLAVLAVIAEGHEGRLFSHAAG